MNVEITRSALADLHRLIAKYEEARPGYGTIFQTAVERAVSNIARSPQLYALTEDGIRGLETRNAIIGRFRVRAVYLVLPDVAKIVSILDGRRRPGSWHSSMDDG